MMKFRKKPMVIEAVQFTQEMFDTNQNLPKGVVCNHTISFRGNERFAGYILKTLEQDLCVSVNDWIITGIKGEKHPCKPDVFEMTYERVYDPFNGGLS